MVARVGDDAFGQKLKTGLQDEGVAVDRVLKTPQCASGLAVVAVDDSGENAITVIPAPNGRLTVEDVHAAADVIRGADVMLLQLEIPLESVLAAIDLARKSQTLVILDPAPAPISCPARLLNVDVVCPNEVEATALTGVEIQTPADSERAARRLRELGARHAVITLGSQGALLCGLDGRCESIPSFEVKVVDTTAAGDAFAAALALSLAEGKEISAAVRFACAAGAVAASRPGRSPPCPRPPMSRHCCVEKPRGTWRHAKPK